MEKIFQANGPKKQAGVVIVASTKTDFKPKLIRRNGGGHYILINGKISQEGITVLNNYAPNTRVPKSVKETLLSLTPHTDPHTVMVGDFNSKYSILTNR